MEKAKKKKTKIPPQGLPGDDKAPNYTALYKAYKAKKAKKKATPTKKK